MTGEVRQGDCLAVLRDLPAAGVDLIYMDPPFNTGRDHTHDAAVFSDDWRSAEAAGADALAEAVPALGALVTAAGLCHGEAMAAYLVFMGERLRECRRVLAPTGTLYLHCSPAAGGYLRGCLDAIFGPAQLREEISWTGYPGRNQTRRGFPRVRDTIFRVTASDRFTFSTLFRPYTAGYIEAAYCHTEPDGRRYRLHQLVNSNRDRSNLRYKFLGHDRTWIWTRKRMEAAKAAGRVVQTSAGTLPKRKIYLDEGPPGRLVTNDWSDLKTIQHGEHCGYPTQKPLALLSRIVSASSLRGDLVLDPFCGSGTALVAARQLERRWLGIDASPDAVRISRERLTETLL